MNKDFKVGVGTTINELKLKKCMKCEPYETGFIEMCKDRSNCAYGKVISETKGRKDDNGKLMLAQFYKHFPNAYKAMVETAMYGFKKYNENIHDPNWKKNDIEQYEDAIFRHFDKYLTGEAIDLESGKKHLAHIIWNACVLYELNEVQNENT